MFTLEKLEVAGFRGFVDEKEFQFGAPLIILYGENHRGKSSTLNAIEWCLFGSECLGKKTGIRERIDWEVANRNAGRGDVRVRATFSGSDGLYVVERIAGRGGRRSSDSVSVSLPKGEVLEGAEAESLLNTLFHSSFRDFMTTVYQHQEAIRAILTDEPKDRNDALDRLLGLSDYREILKGIRDARVDSEVRGMESDFQAFEGRVEQSMKTLENLIKEERERALAKGLNERQLNETGALRYANETSEMVEALARELGAGNFSVTKPEGFDEIDSFMQQVRSQVSELWAQSPDVAKHQELAQKQQRFAALSGELTEALEEEQRVRTDKEELVRKFDTAQSMAKEEEGLKDRLREIDEQMNRASAKATLTREAIKYLTEATSEADKGICPLCGSRTPELLSELEREWSERLEKEIGHLEEERKHCTSHIVDLEARLEDLKRLESRLNDKTRVTQSVIEAIGEELRRKISPQDDPLALLNAEATKTTEETKAAEEAIRTKREKIDIIEGHVAELGTIREIVSHERKRELVQRIRGTKEFVRLQDLRDQAASLAEASRTVRSCVATASRNEAQSKIDAAQAALNDHFCKIADHPAVRGLELEVDEDSRTGLNSYTLKSGDGSDPMPILSQGDLNCLALSLFLGLAQATSDRQAFGFLMLDDPTQSMGSLMKRQFVGVLNDVVSWRNLVIATPDEELKEMLVQDITRNKALYEYADWSENKGPSIERGS